MTDNKTQNRAWLSIVAVVLLFVMWAVTTYAFVASFVSENDNLFETARVKIVLNEGKLIFDENDFQMEPGRTLVKNFTVRNDSTVPVYYRLYLGNLQGALQEALSFKIYDGDELVYSTKMKNFTMDAPFLSGKSLEVGEVKELSAHVVMDPVTGNYYQDSNVTFDVVAEATQVNNNPNMEFDPH